MPHVLLDTDVWSFFFRQDTRAREYAPHILNNTPCLSMQSVAELYQWAEIHRWGVATRARLDQYLRHYVVLPLDDAVARLWGHIRAVRQMQGCPLSAQDAWIAACALRYDCPLLTHNAKDYEDIEGLRVVTESPGPHAARGGSR